MVIASWRESSREKPRGLWCEEKSELGLRSEESLIGIIVRAGRMGIQESEQVSGQLVSGAAILGDDGMKVMATCGLG